MPKTVVAEDQSFRVKIVVESTTKTTVNPNGRGYDADNVEQILVGDVLDVTISATSAEDARAKVAALMLLIE